MTQIDWIEETEDGYRLRVESETGHSIFVRFDDMDITMVSCGRVAIAFYMKGKQIAYMFDVVM